MKNTKKKLTYKDMMSIMQGMQLQINTLKQASFTTDKALDEYVKFNDNKKEFIQYLEDNYKEDVISEEDKLNKELDDKDNKKAEDK